MNAGLDDPAFPGIAYRRGTAGVPQPVLRGSGLRVQTVVVAARAWGLSPDEIASQFALSQRQVEECLRFYESHRAEIDAHIAAEETLDQRLGRPDTLVE